MIEPLHFCELADNNELVAIRSHRSVIIEAVRKLSSGVGVVDCEPWFWGAADSAGRGGAEFSRDAR